MADPTTASAEQQKARKRKLHLCLLNFTRGALSPFVPAPFQHPLLTPLHHKLDLHVTGDESGPRCCGNFFAFALDDAFAVGQEGTLSVTHFVRKLFIYGGSVAALAGTVAVAYVAVSLLAATLFPSRLNLAWRAAYHTPSCFRESAHKSGESDPYGAFGPWADAGTRAFRFSQCVAERTLRELRPAWEMPLRRRLRGAVSLGSCPSRPRRSERALATKVSCGMAISQNKPPYLDSFVR